ncbi:glycerophosphodiester phosphodiesterase [Sanguibacter sp. 25GB23B1]|uniref:glycerophosphodiester phosphodiesterase n=1 Tax=unclassified Sanguibacter TaxID=2645534 RepID=UPI0032AF27C8
MTAPSGPPTGTAVISHRGDTVDHRENTLAAIRSAMDHGAHAVEVDVQLSADGIAVLAHDETFERVWGDPRPVASMTWSEIATLGSGTDRVPRLEEALELSVESGVPLVLDQKHPAAGLAAARLVERTGADLTQYCGSTEGLLGIRSMDPGAVIYLNDTSLGLPDVRLLAALRPRYYNPYWRFLAPATVEAMHAFDILVSCWTPNEDAELALVLDMGVDGVMTDRIDRLQLHVDKRAA